MGTNLSCHIASPRSIITGASETTSLSVQRQPRMSSTCVWIRSGAIGAINICQYLQDRLTCVSSIQLCLYPAAQPLKPNLNQCTATSQKYNCFFTSHITSKAAFPPHRPTASQTHGGRPDLLWCVASLSSGTQRFPWAMFVLTTGRPLIYIIPAKLCHSFRKVTAKVNEIKRSAPWWGARQAFGNWGLNFTAARVRLTGHGDETWQRCRAGAAYRRSLAVSLSMEVINVDHPTACLADMSPDTLYTDVYSMLMTQKGNSNSGLG